MANFIIGDYEYTTLESSPQNTVGAKVVDNTKFTYSDIPATVTYNNVVYNVTSLYECFSNCRNLEVPPNIPITITNMGSCFWGCTALVNAPTIPDSVTDMGDCFRGCTSFNKPITIPNLVTNMDYCFNNCTLFNSLVTFEENSQVTGMSYCFSYCTSFNQSITIPDSVTSMSGCFSACSSFNQPITIPNSVTNMDYCFNNCISFNQSIKIPNSVTSMPACFNNCTSLNNYIFCFNKPISYVLIFANTIEDINIIAIGNDNYSTWKTIKNNSGNNIKIPNNFEFEYGDYKYTGVSGGGKDYIQVQTIDKTKVEYGEILSTYINNRKVTDTSYCFRNCTSFNQLITIPNSVTDMTSCFSGCTSLITAPVIPNSVTDMGSCFFGCTSLITAPTIPDTVTGMGNCFSGCTALTIAPVISDSVTNMNGCFEGCTALITAPIIPNSVTGMWKCFSGCTSLSGDIYIYTTYNSLSYLQCFYNTSYTICLHAMDNNTEECDALASTANNNNVYVNVKPETALNFNNTQVNYLSQNSEFIALSMQTNANLIQCRIPKLSGGGASIITTNLNDALIDLYRRKVGGV